MKSVNVLKLIIRIFQSQDLCPRALDANPACTKKVRRNGEKKGLYNIIGW